jgi:hypothetical protein
MAQESANHAASDPRSGKFRELSLVVLKSVLTDMMIPERLRLWASNGVSTFAHAALSINGGSECL